MSVSTGGGLSSIGANFAYLGGAAVTTATVQSWSSGIPFVLSSSGAVNNTAGAITATTAMDYVIGPSYAYFPTAALNATSAAGWYYTVWSAATLAVVYADVYTSGIPSIPASPTALVTVAGSYTQSTGSDIIGPNVTIPANSLGNNGVIEWQRVANNNNSAGNKIYNTYFGGTLAQGITQTTNPKEAGMGTIKNRGRKTAQISANASHGDNGNASTLPKLSIDTASNQIFSLTVQLATATDYAIIESFAVKAVYGA